MKAITLILILISFSAFSQTDTLSAGDHLIKSSNRSYMAMVVPIVGEAVISVSEKGILEPKQIRLIFISTAIVLYLSANEHIKKAGRKLKRKK